MTVAFPAWVRQATDRSVAAANTIGTLRVTWSIARTGAVVGARMKSG